MKKQILVSILVLAPSLSFARSLTCWNSYSRQTKSPVLRAEIVHENRLKSVLISDALTNDSKLASVKGTISGRSLSKGSKKERREFILNKNAQLILPSNLKPGQLQASRLEERTGQKINGILILKNQYKVKMFCQSI